MSCCVLILALVALTHSRVIQVTTHNVELVLSSVPSLHLLFHNPNCPYSRAYAQRFLQSSPKVENIGIADCLTQQPLCSHLNATRYPSLAVLTNDSMSPLAPYKFLLEQGLANATDPQVQLEDLLQRLYGELGWAVVVLELQEMPVISRIEDSREKGVYYVTWGSTLHSSLMGLVDRREGCWILQKQGNDLEKYNCGKGYEAAELQKHIQSHKAGRMIRHRFGVEGKVKGLSGTELEEMLADTQKKFTHCQLVYFDSDSCPSCSEKDYNRVKQAIVELQLEKKISLHRFSVDKEEVPASLRLNKLPELIEFCNAETSNFGAIFTPSSIKTFLSRDRNAPPPSSPPSEQEKVHEEVVTPESEL